MGEITALEEEMANLMPLGKNFFIISVPPAPIVMSTNQKKKARNFINQNLASLVKRANAKQSKGIAAFIDENEGNYNQATDFTDERHLSPIAVERMVSKIDEILPTTQKLKNTNLSEHSTCKPYRGCYGTYPVGCSYCTKLNHEYDICRASKGTEKRNLSSGSQGSTRDAKQQQKVNLPNSISCLIVPYTNRSSLIFQYGG